MGRGQRPKTQFGVQLSQQPNRVEGKQNVERERADRVKESGRGGFAGDLAEDAT